MALPRRRARAASCGKAVASGRGQAGVAAAGGERLSARARSCAASRLSSPPAGGGGAAAAGAGGGGAVMRGVRRWCRARR